MMTVVGLGMLGLALVGWASDRLWPADSQPQQSDEAPPTL